jgi:hypothetical protein
MNNQDVNSAQDASKYRSLYLLGGIAAFVQLAAILGLLIVTITLGPRPESAEEYFTIQQINRWASMLRGDFLLLFLIGPYLFTFGALYFALRRVNPVVTGLAVLFTYIAVILTFASEATFALQYLGDLYASAASELEQAQYLAAGEAVLAAGMWNSSASFVSGILLQGAGVMISIVMLRGPDFSKITAISGLIGNGLDLIQHVIHPFSPSLSATIQSLMGVFYLVWFPMLGRDLIRLWRRTDREEVPDGQGD